MLVLNDFEEWKNALDKAPKKPDISERIFSCMAATGIAYSDKGREHAGDYAPLGILYYSTLEAKIHDSCPPELRTQLLAEMAFYQARRGEMIQISTSGQTLTLGHALPTKNE